MKIVIFFFCFVPFVYLVLYIWLHLLDLISLCNWTFFSILFFIFSPIKHFWYKVFVAAVLLHFCVDVNCLCICELKLMRWVEDCFFHLLFDANEIATKPFENEGKTTKLKSLLRWIFSPILLYFSIVFFFFSKRSYCFHVRWIFTTNTLNCNVNIYSFFSNFKTEDALYEYCNFSNRNMRVKIVSKFICTFLALQWTKKTGTSQQTIHVLTWLQLFTGWKREKKFEISFKHK